MSDNGSLVRLSIRLRAITSIEIWQFVLVRMFFPVSMECMERAIQLDIAIASPRSFEKEL